MLQELFIRQFAIIDDIRISFQDGLTIMSGETGAGKSIIINAVNLLLGSRASEKMIRTGADTAEVEALFQVEAGKKGTVIHFDFSMLIIYVTNRLCHEKLALTHPVRCITLFVEGLSVGIFTRTIETETILSKDWVLFLWKPVRHALPGPCYQITFICCCELATPQYRQL
jgi:energy-coupling factor transporter ATP-binding protein EcfA2